MEIKVSKKLYEELAEIKKLSLEAEISITEVYMIDRDKYGVDYKNARLIGIDTNKFLLYPTMYEIDNKIAFAKELEKIKNYEQVADGPEKICDMNDEKLVDLICEYGYNGKVYDFKDFFKRKDGAGRICTEGGSCVYEDILNEYLKETNKPNDIVVTSDMVSDMIEQGIYVYTYEGDVMAADGRGYFIKKYDEEAKRYYYIQLSRANNVESLARKIQDVTETETDEFTRLFKCLKDGIDSVYSIDSIEKCKLNKQLLSLEDDCFIDFDSFKNIELKFSPDITYTVDSFHKEERNAIYSRLFKDIDEKNRAIFKNKDLAKLGRTKILRIPEWAKYTGGLISDDVEEIDFGSIFGIVSYISCENLSTIRFGSNIEYIKDCAFIDCRKINKICVPDRKTMNFIMGQFIGIFNFSKIEFYIDDKKVNSNVDIDEDDVKIKFLEGKLVIPDGISILDKETFDKIIEKLWISKSEIKEIDFNQVVEIREGSMNDLWYIEKIDLRDVARIEYNTFVTGRLQKIECSGKFLLNLANKYEDANSVFSKKCFGDLFTECDELFKRNELSEKKIKETKICFMNIFGFNFDLGCLRSLKEVLFSEYEEKEDEKTNDWQW